MKKLMTVATLCVATLGLLSNVTLAQNKPFSISFGGGAGSVPLNDVIRFTDKANEFISDAGRNYQFFKKEDHGKFGYVKIAYPNENIWGTALLVETINISARGKSNHISYGDSPGSADEVWEFTAVPISVLFEYFFNGRDNRFSPVLGIGPSLYISRVVRKDVFSSATSNEVSFSEVKNTLFGYGVQLYFELQKPINNRFFVNSRFQARLAEGMHVNDEQAFNSYDVDFTGVDYTLGFGWRF